METDQTDGNRQKQMKQMETDKADRNRYKQIKTIKNRKEDSRVKLCRKNCDGTLLSSFKSIQIQTQIQIRE